MVNDHLPYQAPKNLRKLWAAKLFFSFFYLFLSVSLIASFLKPIVLLPNLLKFRCCLNFPIMHTTRESSVSALVNEACFFPTGPDNHACCDHFMSIWSTSRPSLSSRPRYFLHDFPLSHLFLGLPCHFSSFLSTFIDSLSPLSCLIVPSSRGNTSRRGKGPVADEFQDYPIDPRLARRRNHKWRWLNQKFFRVQ